jgi:hypothetical protein
MAKNSRFCVYILSCVSASAGGFIDGNPFLEVTLCLIGLFPYIALASLCLRGFACCFNRLVLRFLYVYLASLVVLIGLSPYIAPASLCLRGFTLQKIPAFFIGVRWLYNRVTELLSPNFSVESLVVLIGLFPVEDFR